MNSIKTYFDFFETKKKINVIFNKIKSFFNTFKYEFR